MPVFPIFMVRNVYLAQTPSPSVSSADRDKKHQKLSFRNQIKPKEQATNTPLTPVTFVFDHFKQFLLFARFIRRFFPLLDDYYSWFLSFFFTEQKL